MTRGWMLAMLAGCSGTSVVQQTTARTEIPTPHALPAATDATGPVYRFTEDVPFAELSIPADSRNGQLQLAGAAIRGLKRVAGDDKVGYTFETANPTKPRGLFFFGAPKGMKIVHNGVGQVPYRARDRRATALSWAQDRDTLKIRSPDPEVPTNLVLSYPKAVERERALHYALAQQAGLVDDEADFVRNATVQAGWTSRRGLLLPAPAKASFDVEVPPSGVLSFAPGLAKPEFNDLGDSDGCTIRVTLGDEVLYEGVQQAGVFGSQRLDLSAHAGKKARLTFATLPGDTALNDLCFVGEPTLAPVKADPRRVVMVFVDTVRTDHLSLYGYERPTTPRLAAFAKDAAVFEQARSVAPWTLPSARTVVTGRHPEYYGTARTIQSRLADEGFVTGMIAGNVYLTANFDMHRDWDFHTVDLFPPANEVTDQALDWLGEHRGTDQLLMVHYMSAHLPYREPEPYLSMFAGDRPDGFRSDSFILRDVHTADRQGLGASGRQYLRDRYDQTLRWLDDEVSRLFDALDDDDIVVLFSDHGEEFWDHDGFEHGHTLYDELLRVPLVIRGPGMQAGRSDVPVSLLDVAPTVLDLLEVDAGEVDGTSLVRLASGDATLTNLLRERPQTFGRPLYGRDRWGVLAKDRKWTTHRGQESLFDLAKDPGEQNDLGNQHPDVPRLRELAGQPLGTEGGVAYRFLPSAKGTSRRDVRLTLNVPGGIDKAWLGGDPFQRTPTLLTRVDDDTLRIHWQRGSGDREVYVVPKEPVAEVTHKLNGEVAAGRHYEWSIPPTAPAEPDQARRRLAQLSIPEGAITVYWGMAPPPPVGALELDATDDETKSALAELGYVPREDDEEEQDDGADGEKAADDVAAP